MKGAKRAPATPEKAPARRPGRPRREEPRERLAVLLPPELKRELRIRAIDEDRDVSDVVIDAVRGYLRRKPASRA